MPPGLMNWMCTTVSIWKKTTTKINCLPSWNISRNSVHLSIMKPMNVCVQPQSARRSRTFRQKTVLNVPILGTQPLGEHDPAPVRPWQTKYACTNTAEPSNENKHPYSASPA
ncbi:hypothetical protein LSAT2_009887 [Lamellibrachia satsuma]|nr:hypothetical protein LSAT2_009887 [Lamellibrachia satsuma]